MGTYDTRGGTPISPNYEEPYIYDEEERALEILEGAEVPTDVCDKVLEIIHDLAERADVAGAELKQLHTGDRIVIPKTHMHAECMLRVATVALEGNEHVVPLKE